MKTEQELRAETFEQQFELSTVRVDLRALRSDALKHGAAPALAAHHAFGLWLNGLAVGHAL